MEENCETKTKKDAQVQYELLIGSTILDQLTDVVGRLEERLWPVLRNEPQCAPDDEALGSDKVREFKEVVPLAGDIRGLRLKIGCQKEKIEDILVRLEL